MKTCGRPLEKSDVSKGVLRQTTSFLLVNQAFRPITTNFRLNFNQTIHLSPATLLSFI